MSNTKGHMAIAAAITTLSASPSVEVRNFHLLGDGRARIVADVYHTATSKDNHDEVLKVINDKLQTKMRAVAGSFDSLSSTNFMERVTGIVSVNKQSFVPDSDMKGFTALASNMFMDEEENMWVLRRTEGGNLLIKTTGVEDDVALSGLLQATCSTKHASNLSHAHKSLSNYQPFKCESGDLVTFIDPNGQPVLGFVVANDQESTDLVVQSQFAAEPEVIKVEAVIEKHDVSGIPDDADTQAETVQASVSAARGVVSLAEMAAYYKRVFIRRPAYFQEFMKRARAHKFA